MCQDQGFCPSSRLEVKLKYYLLSKCVGGGGGGGDAFFVCIADLFVVQSNLYDLKEGQLVVNPKRPFPTVPLVNLGEEFRKVNVHCPLHRSFIWL